MEQQGPGNEIARRIAERRGDGCRAGGMQDDVRAERVYRGGKLVGRRLDHAQLEGRIRGRERCLAALQADDICAGRMPGLGNGATDETGRAQNDHPPAGEIIDGHAGGTCDAAMRIVANSVKGWGCSGC